MSERLWIVSDKDSTMDALLKTPEYADDANDCRRPAFYNPAGGWSGTDAEGFIDVEHVDLVEVIIDTDQLANFPISG